MNVGLLGHGVVGGGVAELLLHNADVVEAAAGRELKLARILDLRDFDVPYGGLFVKDAAKITQAGDIDIVVECMGGVEPAFSFLRDALEQGKHCVTSNKQLVVEKGEELLALAAKHKVHFLYEASCGGGIPVLSPIRDNLGANHILSILGILNGTTNYILTSMMQTGAGYQDALCRAQELGYAEKDPTADVEGHDARRKIAILSHLSFGSRFSDEAQYPCTGISQITHSDILFAKQLGRTIRLLGSASRIGERYTACVWPYLLPASHPLSGVQDVLNAIHIKADMVNEVMFYGPGAGKLPTASAVVGDAILAATRPVRPLVQAEHLTYMEDSQQPLQYFVRLEGPSPQAAEAAVGELMPQAELLRLDATGEIALLTPCLPRKSLDDALARLEAAGISLGQRLRYLGE